MTETYRIRNPEDMLAVVPLVLGFHPADSLVMLTFPTRAKAFHARVDLPGDEAARTEAAACLLDAALRNDVDRVAFAAYAGDGALARGALLSAHDAFDAADLDVIDLLWAHAPLWESIVSDRSGCFEADAHPFAVRAVVDGRVTHGSREELAATVAPVPALVEACRAALASAPPRPRGAVSLATEAVLAHVADRSRPDDETLAGLVTALADEGAWVAVWALCTREAARDHVAFWTDVVRRCPEELVAGPAALLGHAAWLSGDGALAWCAVDRCRAAEPAHPGADVVAELLEQAVSPSRWQRTLQEPA